MESTNVVQIGDWTGTSVNQTITTSGGYETTGGWINIDTNLPYEVVTNWNWYPSYSYPVYKTDKVAELKAWLDGYCTDRKMTEKALKKIREKIESF